MKRKQSVTIVGPKTTVCDALSTAIFVHPNPVEILAKYPDYGAIIVDEKGNFCPLGKTYGASFLNNPSSLLGEELLTIAENK